MASRLHNARALRSLIHTVVAAGGAGVVSLVGLSSCGGTTGVEESAESTDAGADTRCRIVGRGDASGYGSCTSWQLEVAGNVTAAACGLPDSGYGSGSECTDLCGFAEPGGQLSCSLSGTTVRCGYTCVVDGRRPPELADAPSDRETVGAWFATMAFHEAASVDAFAILGSELRAHGAPQSLLRSIQRARRDEVRHARSARAMARRHGARSRAPRVLRPQTRSLKELALENAREGCGRETLGALVGVHQAEHAATEEIRAFYRAIARDELRHAALSWRMHAWLLSQLPPADRDQVEAAVRDALEAMTIEATEELAVALGLPSSTTLSALKLAVLTNADARETRSRAA